MTPAQRAVVQLTECRHHAEIVAEALNDIAHYLPFTKDNVQTFGKEQTQILDQIAYRFMKLQDSMGQKLLPLVLELAQEPIAENVTFAEKLNTLERIGALPSAEQWRKLRIARNALAHEYPDDPELQASAINRFLEGTKQLCELYTVVEKYMHERLLIT